MKNKRYKIEKVAYSWVLAVIEKKTREQNIKQRKS